jgi:hypothetical protein
VSTMTKSRASLLACAALVTFALACAKDGPTTLQDSPLQGLTKVASNDSSTNAPTPPPSGPGAVHGFVLGQAEPGSGPDTLTNSPRVANTRVTAFPRVASNGVEPVVGPEAASVLTDANGAFTLPSLPGGEYVVTFAPPDASLYRGVYVTGTIHSRSGEYSWWIVLPKK